LESDGFLGDFYGPQSAQQGPTRSVPGEYLDHFYSNILAGYDEFGGLGDPHDALGTLALGQRHLRGAAPPHMRWEVST